MELPLLIEDGSLMLIMTIAIALPLLIENVLSKFILVMALISRLCVLRNESSRIFGAMAMLAKVRS